MTVCSTRQRFPTIRDQLFHINCSTALHTKGVMNIEFKKL
jgi:hypothetical protein